ncbi:hypothetical protein H0H93_015260, partial [Arthromyces matolae]
CDVKEIDELSLLMALKRPLPRQILDAAVQWAMKTTKTSFWHNSRRNSSAKVESPRESVMAVRKSGISTISRNKSDEDEAHITKLQQLGMTSVEESQLLAMRDYILKLANATSSFASRVNTEPETGKNLKVTGDIELQKLGIVPQTVFLKARTSSEFTPRSSRFTSSSRRSTLDSGRTPLLSPRPPGAEYGGAPFEDLRRRLATINGSVSSVGLAPPPLRGNFSPVAPSTISSSQPPSALPATTFERPSSPTESILSTANSQTFRPTSRLHIG